MAVEKTKRKINKKRGQIVFATVMLFIPLVQFFLFYVCVNFNSVLMAFQKYTRTSAGWVTTFAGFDNFKSVFSKIFITEESAELGAAFGNSLLMCFLNLTIKTFLALLFSFYICKRFLLHKVYRTLLYLPNIISSVVLVVIFKYFIDDALVAWSGQKLRNWIGEQNKTILMFYAIWAYLGTTVLVYSNAMGAVSDSIVESARLDGAGFFTEFWCIYVPLIFPTMITFIVSALAVVFIDQMNLFSFYTRSAEPENVTIGYYLYRETQRAGTDLSKYPELSAFGLVLTAVCAPLTLGIRKLLLKIGGSDE
jgi:ABC-type sugar transport system permease subunit